MLDIPDKIMLAGLMIKLLISELSCRFEIRDADDSNEQGFKQSLRDHADKPVCEDAAHYRHDKRAN